MGWLKVTDCPEDKWHNLAFSKSYQDGTYELCGPKIQGNPENLEDHVLIAHDNAEILDLKDRTFEGIKNYLQDLPYEGVVFKHEDGRQAKIKRRDFNYESD